MPMNTVNYDHLRLSPSDRVLDVGCGEGRHSITAYMLEPVEAVGVDLSLDDLKVCRERFEAFRLAEDCNRSLVMSVADGGRLPFADNSFDRVICSEVLEHIPDYRSVIKEATRVLKTGGVLAVSVPRFFPEWVCWRLSRAYHSQKGGHIRIFRSGQLRRAVEDCGLIHVRRHWAHALHVPYWWLKCAFWKDEGEDAWIVRTYHRLLVWDLMKQPRITRWLEAILDPLMGKSVVMYFVKGL